jgi:hypothetical protein
MGNSYGPKSMVQDGLVFAADAGNTMCYTSGSATATDLIGGLTCTLNNGVGSPIIPSSNSWRFDGSDDEILSTTGPTLSASASFSCWFNPDSYANYKGIVSSKNYYTGGYNNNWSIQVMANKNIRTIFCNGTSINEVQASPGDLTGTWNNLVVVTEGSSTVKTYVNNSLLATVSLTQGQTNPLADVSNGIRFAGTYASSQHFDGSVGCMLFYNKTLSTAEMLQNYNATKGRFGL